MITFEKLRELIEEIELYTSLDYYYIDKLKTIYILQQKSEKLLGLYKEKISVLENSKYLNRFSRSFDDVEVTKLSSVTTKISKLEEEMK